MSSHTSKQNQKSLRNWLKSDIKLRFHKYMCSFGNYESNGCCMKQNLLTSPWLLVYCSADTSHLLLCFNILTLTWADLATTTSQQISAATPHHAAIINPTTNYLQTWSKSLQMMEKSCWAIKREQSMRWKVCYYPM